MCQRVSLTIRVLGQCGLVGLGRVAGAVDVLGADPEVVLLALLQVLDHTLVVVDDDRYLLPEVRAFLALLDQVVCKNTKLMNFNLIINFAKSPQSNAFVHTYLVLVVKKRM